MTDESVKNAKDNLGGCVVYIKDEVDSFINDIEGIVGHVSDDQKYWFKRGTMLGINLTTKLLAMINMDELNDELFKN